MADNHLYNPNLDSLTVYALKCFKVAHKDSPLVFVFRYFGQRILD